MDDKLDFEEFSAFILSVNDRYCEYYSKENEPILTFEQRIHQGSGFSISYIQKTYYALSLRKVWEHIVYKNEHISKWTDDFSLNAKLDINYAGPRDRTQETLISDHYQLIWGTMLEPFIVAMEKGLDLNNREARMELFNLYEDYWSRDYTECTIILPLSNIVPSSESPIDVDLGSGIRLSTLTNDDKDLIWRIYREFPFINLGNFASCSLKISATFNKRKSNFYLDSFPPEEDNSITDVKTKIEIALCALRLTLGGNYGAPYGYILTLDPRETSKGYLQLENYPGSSREITILETERFDANGLKTMYHNLERIWKLPIQLGVSYFNKISVRTERSDAIIDVMIALESLILHGIRDELKYRLALRSAYILKNEYSTKKVFTILSVAYDIRSKIVH